MSDKQPYTLWHTVFIRTLLFEPAPLLDEAHEGSDSCARADHDHWVCGFEGQAELRLADVHGNGRLVAVVCDQFVLQPVGGNSFIGAASLGLVLDHDSTDVDAVGVDLQKERAKQNSTLILRSDQCFCLFVCSSHTQGSLSFFRVKFKYFLSALPSYIGRTLPHCGFGNFVKTNQRPFVEMTPSMSKIKRMCFFPS